MWFDVDIIAGFIRQIASNVSDFVVLSPRSLIKNDKSLTTNAKN